MVPVIPPQPTGRRTADIVATVVLSVVLVLGSVSALGFSMFFVLITDGCYDVHCRTDLLGWAYVVAWGGIGLTLLGTAVAVWICAVKRRVMFVWPLLGIGLVAVFTTVAVSLANSVLP